MMQFTTVIATLMLFACGLALIYASRPRKAKDVLWLPFVYFYWSLQAFIALYAVLLILLRRPRKWARTDKKGVVTGTNITSEAF
jgi:membrane protein implicated in regulation of membrane protease activity